MVKKGTSEYILDIFSALDDPIELIPLGLSQASQDTFGVPRAHVSETKYSPFFVLPPFGNPFLIEEIS